MDQPRNISGQSRNQPTSDPTLVPLLEVSRFDQLVGQAAGVKRLYTFGELYRNMAAVPEHILLTGTEGSGKQTLLRAFAKEFNVGLRQCDAERLEKKADLTAIITGLGSGEALLITNLQLLRKPIREVLAEAAEHFRVSLIISGQGGQRIHPFYLNRFTLLATAPRIADVPAELAGCFSVTLTLDPYSNEELEKITCLLALPLRLTMTPEAAHLIAMSGQRTPSSIDQLLRKFARLGKVKITEADAKEVLAAFGLAPPPTGSHIGTNNLDKLSGVDFERLITSLLQSMGFHAEMTRATGDGGIDIVANLNKPIVGGRYLIQCKRFGALVGAPTIREFYGAVVADRMAKGILITTSGFTDQAREFARGLPLELIDRNQLEKLLAESGQPVAPAPPPRPRLF